MSDETLFEFPCQFPIKAMGRRGMALDVLVVGIIARHVAHVPAAAVKTRPSKDGNFVSVTVTIEATSKRQLDAIYQELTDHPLVLVAL